MRVPFSWLQEHFDEQLDAEAIAEQLTRSGIEVESLTPVGVRHPSVVCGEVLGVEPLPGADGLQRVLVQADRRRSIVTNARGVTVGRKLAVALPGATIFDADGTALREVSETVLYGQPSEAVLCSEGDLGIAARFDELVPLDASTAAGAPALAVLTASPDWYADQVLHLAILPNIARCQAVRGVAREVSALARKRLAALQEPATFETGSSLAPTVTAREACLALTVTLIENVRVTESPEWLKRRLVVAGIGPINNIVDITNYVMLEFGQPTHAYDADKLPSLDLGVRSARTGDRLLTLQQADGDEPIAVPEGVPLIVSADVPVAAAGVIGGRPTAIAGDTRRVLLESAAFEFVAIRRAQQALKTYTEASARFSRGVNPELPPLAARRFLELLRLTAPDARVVAHGVAGQTAAPRRRIELTLAQLNGSLGTALTLAQAESTLQRAGLSVQRDERAGALSVDVDPSRQDLTLACDLIEEIARLEGYDLLPETMPTDAVPELVPDELLSRREVVRDRLVRLGLQEIISYTLNGPSLEARLYAGRPSLPPPPPVQLVNPVSVDRSVLRSSLLPGLLASAAMNARHEPLCRLFEIGPTFAAPAIADELPLERERVGFLLAGCVGRSTMHDKKPRDVDFFDAKALLTELFSGLHLDGIEYETADEPPYRPGACARITRNGTTLGLVGALHPLVLREFELHELPVLAVELDLKALVADWVRRPRFRDYDRLPSIELDIALLADESISARQLTEVVQNTGGAMLKSVEVFDVFRSEQFGPSRKAIAVRFRLNAGDRTLEMSEALEIRSRIARALERELGALIRE